MRLRSLESRIVIFFVILLVAVQGTAFVLVNAANQSIAKQEVANQLDVGSRVFSRVMEQNARQLSQAATVLAADFAFREAVATRDTGTIVSVLANHGARIKASVVMLADLDNKLLADTLHPERRDGRFPFADLIATAAEAGQASAVSIIDGEPYQVVVVPVLAPLTVAWVVMGFKIDDKLANEIQALTSLQVSFVTRLPTSQWAIRASTLPQDQRESSAARFAEHLRDKAAVPVLTIGRDEYETRVLTLQRKGEPEIIVALEQSLRIALEPFIRLRNTLIGLGVASILLSIIGSIVLGRSLARPINRLAVVARKMGDGDYAQVVDIRQNDEIGELANSFRQMQQAISTREEKILRLAYQDTLTELPNRALFNERLDEAVRTAAATGSAVTIFVMDLDRFKYVNDALGHPMGDVVLREVGARLKTLLRASDTIARLGGDEYAIILPDTDTTAAHAFARTIQRSLEDPITLDGQPLDVGCSIGIASYPEHGCDSQTLMRHADIAMYVAKRSNRGHEVFQAAFYRPRQDYLTLLGDLRRAVERDELVLYFQPKVDLRSGRTSHVEALVRWIHPERGYISPGEFIPFAEHTGFIRSITRCIIRKAIQQGRTWMANGIDIIISFNISSRDLVNPDLPAMIENELAANGLKPDRIAIEVTESGFMEDPGQAMDILKRLDALGVRLSIDDYGTGFSSLSYIRKLPVQELKIDQSFVKNMVTDKNDEIIVKSTIDLGHNMGLKVVAEGVEDVESLRLLKQLGCDLAQGYFMSKPLPAAQFEFWLTDGNEYNTMRLRVTQAGLRKSAT